MSRYLKGPLIYGAFNAEGVPSLHNVHRHIRVYGPCWNKWPSSSASRRATLAIRQYVHLPSGPSVNVSPPGILSVSSSPRGSHCKLCEDSLRAFPLTLRGGPSSNHGHRFGMGGRGKLPVQPEANCRKATTGLSVVNACCSGGKLHVDRRAA